MNLTIGVLYSCPECGLKDIEVRVKARELEPIEAWMDTCIRALGADHYSRSPECRPEQLKDVKIPMPAGVDRVGGAPAQ